MESDYLPSQRTIAYRDWLLGLKKLFKSVQLKSAVKVNQELLGFYWELGQEIVEKQQQADWGSGFLPQLSKDLCAEFPEIKGFSTRNLQYVVRWYLFYSTDIPIAQQPVAQLPKSPETPSQSTDNERLTNLATASGQIGQQAVARLPGAMLESITSIPWGHNIVIISKSSSLDEALYYVRQTLTHGWSRAVLVHQIESDLFTREGSATSNFATTLPPAQSDLAQQTLKDPYVFDFLTLTKDHNERDIENQLTDHISKFLIELGAGFAYLGRQVPLQVSDRDFFLDLLFYHTQLHCYVVIELKTGDFEPEFAGKLNFYLKAVDESLRTQRDEPTIGILLCKTKNKLIAEYALSDINKPIGVSEYQLTQSLPDSLKPSLPSIEELEAELQQDFDDE
ncbi:MAG: PDDEXK nuclease domain-containing protein [Verrucomicrobiales bacterium]|nr:PDDEXK nuclease domain-containing protein [Verrucomicrobiales bacterium]